MPDGDFAGTPGFTPVGRGEDGGSPPGAWGMRALGDWGPGVDRSEQPELARRSDAATHARRLILHHPRHPAAGTPVSGGHPLVCVTVLPETVQVEMDGMEKTMKMS